MDIIASLRADIGADIVHGPEEADFPRHSRDFVNAMQEDVALLGVAYPRTTAQVSAILRACNEQGITVQPQGGMTGMAGGGVPDRPCLVLSLERMRSILELDADASTITVEAGVVLEAVQQAADAAGLLFPLDLGGRGTAQVGGNASTNAGGNRVLRYGMMRDLVLGVEAVLADGTVITSLNKMLKNNAGYDLKHLFLGSEGTLGIITRLVLRLFPKPLGVSTGLIAVDDYAAVLDLLRRCRGGFGATLSAFEVMWPDFYRLGTTALGRTPPIPHGHGIYVLIETMGTDPVTDQARFEELLGMAIEDGIAKDAVIAQSDAQTKSLWAVRDSPGEWPKVYWPQIGFDVSLPTGEIGARVPILKERLEQAFPGVRMVFFGHVADSNLHMSVLINQDPMPVHAIEAFVYAMIGEWGGSISAEHGIGTVKREFLHHSRTAEELALMRLLKKSLDPNDILNPGKVI
jgi:FAD/FMN-containing dehydrogenase